MDDCLKAAPVAAQFCGLKKIHNENHSPRNIPLVQMFLAL